MLAKRRIPYSVYPSKTAGLCSTLPISTDHKCSDALSFAILRTGPPANAFVRWGGEAWDCIQGIFTTVQ